MAVVGVGHFGRIHAEKIAKLDRAELVAVADVDAARAAEVATEFGVEAFDDAGALLPLVDAVSIAVPTRAHYEVAARFLEHGVHVLLEKPIADNLAAAAALIERADSGNLVFQIGHLPRFSGAATALRERMARPLFIESLRIAPFRQRGTDVSVILDLMIHDIDFILSLVNAPIASIDAAGAAVFTDSEDIANARVKFENGCIANITASRISMKTERQMRVFQPDAYIAIDFDRRQTRTIRKKAGAAVTGIADVSIEEETYEEVDELEREIDAFLAAIEAGSAPLVTGEDGRRALAAAIMIDDSLRANWETARRSA
jgi:predicted dehydrogenase